MIRTRCEELGIAFSHAHIPEHEHFLGGGGHLTAAGNVTLGKQIYETLDSLSDR
jgi:hypothetical protein